MKAYQNLQSFDPDLKFQSWIYRIAHNTFVNGLKKLKKSPFHFFDFDTILSHSVEETTTEVVPGPGEEQSVVLEGALESLPPKYAEVLILHFSEGLSYKEIADVLEIPIGTVGVRINRAKALLKEAIHQTDHMAYE
jgi:RNA polymerase sigma-70 factor (ECF subfamily)